MSEVCRYRDLDILFLQRSLVVADHCVEGGESFGRDTTCRDDDKSESRAPPDI
jgi:hypothetical protein